MDDYYRPLSCSPLAGFIVDSTKKHDGGWVPARAVQSSWAKFIEKKEKPV